MKKLSLAVAACALAVGIVPVAEASTPLNAIISADDPAGNMGDARVRVVHASPDAPAVDVWVDGTLVFENAPFEGITDFAAVPGGTYNVQVVPSGATEPVVIEADLELENGVDYTVVATDMLANITPIILTAAGGTPAAGNAWVRFFHGSPDAPAVDIAVTGGDVLIGNVAFQQFSEYLPVPAGTYDLEARVAGTDTVALPLPGIVLEDGGVYTAYATGLLADSGAMDNFYFIPAAARAEGANDSFYYTDVDVHNAGDSMATFQYLWLPRDTDNSDPVASDEFMLEPGETIRHADVLGAAFGVMDGTDALGALAVISDSADLLLFSRTFNAATDGTYGQAMPGLAAAELIPADTRMRILYFTENDTYRSNIGLVNGTGAPIMVYWDRYLADGTMVDSGSAELPAWGNTQLNSVFAGEAPVEGAYIDVWTDTADGAFAAYGSVLDNTTSDPTTVMPR
jgi:hypothetical protein